ncbi:noggin-3-like [Betta splendens]|uniref:Noggin-3-like n=1 Tax=Betta splendens TaxID=158456 RepID=A0A6P7MRW3_BETSP|nr:noggin-3-like [Betta splendens]
MINTVFLCWICVSGLCESFPFTANLSTLNQFSNATVLDSPFLQLRTRLPSYSQPIRPYSLLTNAEDFHYLPKSRHRRPAQLLRLLGSSYDPFWMSIGPPPEASGGHSDGRALLRGDTLNYTTFKGRFNLSSSPELKEAAGKQHHILRKDVAQLDLGFLSPDVAMSVRAWLLQSATCELHYRWVDLGPAFWPRWVRHTDCGRSLGGRSCSFPRGMECVRAQTAHIRILAWHCVEIRDGGNKSGQIKSERSDDEALIRCLWRQVAYPVVAACACSCV